MSRKFNIGRQNDLLLNEKLHNLLAHLEFIPYRSNDELVEAPKQTRQTPIPYGALWLEQPSGTNIHKLRVHANTESETVEGQWPCLFEGYYHPATLTDLPKKPVHGQIWIDNNNTLRVYDASGSEGQWKVVLAGKASDKDYSVFNGLDFQSIDPLLPVHESGIYSVPYETYGKFFASEFNDDPLSYCHPLNDNNLTPGYMLESNETAITVTDGTESFESKSWVHVNPLNLKNITKRLIKINKNKARYYERVDKEVEGSLLVVSDFYSVDDFNKETMIRVSDANELIKPGILKFKIDEYVKYFEAKDSTTYFIGVPAGQTEYYAFKSGDKIGRLLKRYNLKAGMTDANVTEDDLMSDRNDYSISTGGIILSDKIGEEYDYIYAITYTFKQEHDTDGSLIRTTISSITGNNEIYIGPCNGIPVVFMDGLYLEHYKDDGVSLFYKYENERIIFESDSVLDEMQILVVSFPAVNTYTINDIDYPMEYTITEDDIEENGDVILGPGLKGSLFDKENFPNPIVFYNGLAGYTYVANEIDIDYDERKITIHNFGEMNTLNGSSSVFAVSCGKNPYKSNGVLDKGVIYDENISMDKKYLVIVDGLVMSPFNEDITINSGQITITNASIALDSEYSIIELTNDESDTDSIVCIYDDMMSAFSIAIKDNNAMNTSNAYDDCDSAIVMCDYGVLVDRDAVRRSFDPTDYYIGGQIVQERSINERGEELFTWKMYSYTNDYIVLDPIEDEQIIKDCDNMMTYYANKGSIQINPIELQNKPLTMYAYTFVDRVDEKLQKGNRKIPIYVKNHVEDMTRHHSFVTNRTQLYDTNVNALSVYINGIMTPHTEKHTVDFKSDTFLVDKQYSSSFNHKDDLTDTNIDMYYVLDAIQDTTKLEDIIRVNNKYVYVSSYFNSEHQLNSAKLLKHYINEQMKNNNLMYIIENVESNEHISCHRQLNLPRYKNLPNSYITNLKLSPGIINIYVNGVLLDKSDYSLFDNNKIMISYDLVGGQDLDGQDISDFKFPYRVLTKDGIKYIECEGNDDVVIEVRDDTTLKKISVPIKEYSYDSQTFNIEDYDLPKSLKDTHDLIKIYINGVIYDGDYKNTGGTIKLLEPNILTIDPIYTYFLLHPDTYKEYKKEHGEYVRKQDTITFEWR